MINKPTDAPMSFSPFASRPWTFGHSGVSVDRSMDGHTLIVGSVPRANVSFQNFTYAAK
jgi:hypothetical protein